MVPTAVETATRGRSLGKLALGLRVVRDDGGAIGFRHAFIRALTGVVEIYLTFGGLAVLVGFLNPSSKRLGDLLAGTHAQVERVPRCRRTRSGFRPSSPAGRRRPTSGGCPMRPRGASPRSSRTSTTSCPRAAPASPPRSPPQVAPFVSPLPDAPPERFLAGVVALRRARDLTALRLEDARLESLAPVLTSTPAGFPER